MDDPEAAQAETTPARPQADRVARAVAKAKIAGALFQADERVKLGRYHLLELVGAGGMGVVWGGWDPELDRRVAIKLVQASLASARDRILLEGQALAKLSHPNVVPVFDVGVVDDQVYLVMEYVRGKNLRVHASEPRTVRELVAAYRDAALGLAAAHHAGLIHRDFKPDNAILGDDGRVRLLDFGLARGETAADDTDGAGTPRYMAPEQAQKLALTPAVDQFAWCVSLREALVDRTADGKAAEVPAWLDAIITRGTAPEPTARFASMDELLRALARDPRTVWRRRAIATGALGLAGAAFAVGMLRGAASEPARCTGGIPEIAKTWNDQARAAVVAHVGGLGAYGAEESERLDGELTRYSASWADVHRAACEARARAELTPQLYERSVACLARANAALDTAIHVLTALPAERLPDGVIAVRELPAVARCASGDLGAPVEPPDPAIAVDVARVANDVARARVLAFALDPEAVAASGAAVAAAELLRYQPLQARAELALGLAWLLQHKNAEAAAPLARATELAFVVGDDATAIEAYARQAYVLAMADPSTLPAGAIDALGAIPVVEAIATRLGPGGAPVRALLFNNLGVTKLAAAKRDEAKVWFRRALEQSRLAPRTTELARIPANAALATDRPEEQRALLADALAALTDMVGPNHPFTLDTRLIAGALIGNAADAEREFADLCERYRKYHPRYENVEVCAYEVGWLADERGDTAEARQWMARVTTTTPRSDIARGYLLLDGDPARALTEMAALVKQRSTGELWWMAMGVDASFVAALAAIELGRESEAIASLEHALAVLEPAASTYPRYQRRLARARAMLARLLGRRDPVRAATVARLAADWYRAAGGDDALVAELDKLATP